MVRDIRRKIAGYREALTFEALINLARREFRKRMSVAEAADAQPMFPAVAAHLQRSLPTTINIPDPAEEGEFIYRPLMSATMAELQQCIDARQAQIEADLSTLQALRELHEYRAHEGARPADPVIAAMPVAAE